MAFGKKGIRGVILSIISEVGESKMKSGNVLQFRSM